MKFQGLVCGIPKEIMSAERRVAATPETVRKMIEEGAKILVECGAGAGSYIANEAYTEVGAELIDDVEVLFSRSDLILKVKEPRLNTEKNKHEVDMMKKGQCLVAFLHPAAPHNHAMVKRLAEQGVTALSLDAVPRTPRAQNMDALTSMSTVAGYKAMLLAANHLTKFMPKIDSTVAASPPAEVLIIGAGVAGLQALITAKNLGANVAVVDIRADACERAKSLGASIVDIGIPSELATGQGEGAKRLPNEWLHREQEIIKENVAKSDIVILSILIPGKVAPIIVTQEMVETMRPGSCIEDIAIDQGGNCALSEIGNSIVKHDVTIEAIANIPAMLPSSSTRLFAENLYNYTANLVKDGKIRAAAEDEIISTSLVTQDGQIVHAGTLEAMAAK